VKIPLDTCTVSDYLRGLDPVVQRIQKAMPSDLAISAMELGYGATRRQSLKLTDTGDTFLDGITILPFDAERAGILRATMEVNGYRVALADCQIATTALTCGLTLVSNDGDFCRVPGLKVVYWQSKGQSSCNRALGEAEEVA
jgi:tRNA(fMet)-specific endonuclease VapC